MRKVITVVILIAIIISSCLPAMADELQDVKAKKKAVEYNISNIKEKKTEATTALKKALDVKDDLLDDQKQKNNEISQLESQIKFLNENIEAIKNTLTEAENNLSDQKQLFKTRLKVMYENSDNSFFEDLIGSKNINEFLERLDLMARISKKDKDTVENLKLSVLDVQYKKKQKQIEKVNILKEANEAKSDLNSLKASRASVDDQIRKINRKLFLLEQQEDELNRQAEALNDVIKNLMSRSGKYAGGIMKWPVPSSTKISSPFGYRIHPIYKRRKFHAGIDIDANRGDSIIAANKGTVILAGWQSGYGNTVIIDHGGGIATLYAHCSRILTRVGREVKTGDLIARVGSTGLSTGPHLHFEVRVNGKTTDPMKYFTRK